MIRFTEAQEGRYLMVGGPRPRHKLMVTERCSSSHREGEKENEWEISIPWRDTHCEEQQLCCHLNMFTTAIGGVWFPPTCTSTHSSAVQTVLLVDLSMALMRLYLTAEGEAARDTWPSPHNRKDFRHTLQIRGAKHKLKQITGSSCGFCCECSFKC